MAKLTEAQITKQIRDMLTACNIWHWKHWQGGRQSGPKTALKGISDILGIKKVKVSDLVKANIEEVGIFLACEVKRSGEKASDDQEIFIDRVNKEGGIGFVAYSPDDVVTELRLDVELEPIRGVRASN